MLHVIQPTGYPNATATGVPISLDAKKQIDLPGRHKGQQSIITIGARASPAPRSAPEYT
jgi:hypothetical protein